MFHNPICVRCQIEMKSHKNGVIVVDYAYTPAKPIKLWMADEWACPKCLNCVVLGFAEEPLIQHFENLFFKTLCDIPKDLRRNNFEFRGEGGE